MNRLLFFSFLLLAITSCKKEDTTQTCIELKIEEFKVQADNLPGGGIIRAYEFEEEKYYFFQDGLDHGLRDLYDSDCNLLCESAGEDVACQDNINYIEIVSIDTFKEIIWQSN